jgi:hypothetical protein
MCQQAFFVRQGYRAEADRPISPWGERRGNEQRQERNRKCKWHRNSGKEIMSDGLEGTLGCILMAAISLPLSFYLARGCLRGLLRLLNGSPRRDML